MFQAEQIEKIENKTNNFFAIIREKLRPLVHDFKFDAFILSVILLNAFVLGAMTFPEIYMFFGNFLISVDYICIFIFVIELSLKIFIMRRDYFKDGWNVFDFTVVALSLIPNVGAFIIIRTFRVFRVLRLVSILPSMRKVLAMFIETLPSVFSTLFLMLIVFYVFGVMSVYLFGEVLVDFSSLSLALEALFGFLTFDGWSGEKAQVAMSVYPYSWLFFVMFISIFLLMVINVFTSVVVEGVNNSQVVCDSQKEIKQDFLKISELEEKIEKLEKTQTELLLLLKESLKK